MSDARNPQGESAPIKNRVRRRMDWYRAYEGLPYSSRWRVAARRTKRPFLEAMGVAVCLLDTASFAEDRGDVSSFDPEICAAGLDIETADVEAIVEAFKSTSWIVGSRLATWDDRQTAVSEDPTATQRKRDQRDREKAAKASKVTPVTRDNRDVRQCHDREEQTREDLDPDLDPDHDSKIYRAPSDDDDDEWPSQRFWATDDIDDDDEVVDAFIAAAERMSTDKSPAAIFNFQEARNRRYRGKWPPGQSGPSPLTYYDVRTGEVVA